MQAWGMSVIRTVVPMIVGAGVGWLVAKGLIPESATEDLTGQATVVLTLLFSSAWYAFARWLEPRIPSWASSMLGLLGTPPSY